MKNYTGASPAYLVWKRFCKNKLSLAGAALIVLVAVIAVLGYLVVPDPTPYSNEMNLALSLKEPGFRISMLKVRKNRVTASPSALKKMFSGAESEYEFIPLKDFRVEEDKLVISEYAGTGEELVRRIAIADIVYPLDTDKPVRLNNKMLLFTDVSGRTHAKGYEETLELARANIRDKVFYLGTDRYGRDMLSRLMIGTRITLSVGLISVLISLLVGLSLGSLAGFYRGWVDNTVMWLINVVWSIPTLLLVVAITLALGKGFWQVFIAVGLTMWVEVARVARGQILSLREMEFVEAAKALGFRSSRIIRRHILPNIAGPIIVISASNFASAILLEAGLSFLGVGAQPPTPSWGTMIRENYPYIIMNLAYLAVLPGTAIMLMVLAFNLVGKGLRDAFDSKEVAFTGA
jgi:peptide/nickel transport system permease protein